MSAGPGPQAGPTFSNNPNPGDGKVRFANDPVYLDFIIPSATGQTVVDPSSANNLTLSNVEVVAQGAGSSTPPNRPQLITEGLIATHNPQTSQGPPQVNASNQVQVIAGNPNAATQVRFW